MTEREDFLNTISKIWNSIEPTNFMKDEMSELEGLNDIQRFGKDVIKKEIQISNMLKGFVITRNISKSVQGEIEAEIRDLFTEFLKSISKNN